MKNIVYALIVASLGMPGAASAQVPAEPTGPEHQHVSSEPLPAGPPLTLDAAIGEALANNPGIIALRRDFDVARQRPAAEASLAPPTLEAAIWQWPLTTLNPLDTNMYMFTLHQDIPGGGKRALRAAVSDKDADRALNDIAVKARDVVMQIKRAYTELYVARQAIAIHLAAVDLSRQVADLTMTAYVAGHGGQQDALMAVAEISTLHADLIDMDEQAQLAEAQLNVLLNRDPATPIGELVVAPKRAALPPLADLQQRALRDNGDVHGAALDVERAQAALAVANREYKPDFMVGGGYQLMPRSAGAWTASVGITWPGAPWSRAGLDAKRAEADAAVAAARARQVSVANAVRLAVQEAYTHAEAAAARAALIDTTIIPQSQQVLDVERVAYQSGHGDIATLVRQQHALLNARLDHVRALAVADEARADLDDAVGNDPSVQVAAATEGK